MLTSAGPINPRLREGADGQNVIITKPIISGIQLQSQLSI